MTERRARVERPWPGHFIGASECRFFRTTDVNGYRVSTVGDYRPGETVNKILRLPADAPVPIGYRRLYETMVFPLHETATMECCDEHRDVPAVADWAGCGFAGYQTEAEAIAGHEVMVLQFTVRPAPAEIAG